VENLLARHRNVTILVAVLFAEVIGLAVQVKRTSDTDSTRLIRVWTISTVTPLEKAFVATEQGMRDIWHNYFYLRGVRGENRALHAEIQRLRLEQVRMTEDAVQARRLQRLLAFKEQFISQTLAAQVIGSSGTDLSRIVYIDKGAKEGVRQDLAVITADGIVGKVLHVFQSSSQVLLINDPTSGVGAILEKSRLQGVLKGSAAGETVLEKVMSDERVEPGERVLTSGGDRIFPKGLPIGAVSKVGSGSDLFLNIRVKPGANLSQLEEVLVITKVDERQPTVTEADTPMRAVDILASRLPSVPVKPTEAKAPGGSGGAKPTVPLASSALTPQLTSAGPGPSTRALGATQAIKQKPGLAKTAVVPNPQKSTVPQAEAKPSQAAPDVPSGSTENRAEQGPPTKSGAETPAAPAKREPKPVAESAQPSETPSSENPQ
jgi:rod shape-determining protein MreC